MDRPAPKFSNPGRRRRFSYLATDQKTGQVERRWHNEGLAEVAPLRGGQIARSLRGMVRP